MKKVLLILALAVLVVPAAMADGVDFGINNVSWSWAGGATPLVASDGIGQVFASGTVGANSGTALVGGANFSTGNFVSYNAGTQTFTFGPAAAGTFTIAGCSGPCFTGSIVSLSLVQSQTPGIYSFNAKVVIGDVTAGLFAALGIPAPAQLDNWIGSMNGTLHGTLVAPGLTAGGGSGTISSLDLGLAPIPEPGTLVMFGSGLIGLGGVLRRKLIG